MLYTGYTLCNDQLRRIRNLLCKSLPDFRVRSGIHGAGTVIQNQYLGLLKQRPGDTQTLFLSAGHVGTSLFYVGVIPFRHFLHKFICAGKPAYTPAFLLTGIRIAPAKVLKDRSREKDIFL